MMMWKGGGKYETPSKYLLAGQAKLARLKGTSRVFGVLRHRCLDVFPSVLGIDAFEIVGTWPDVVDRSCWGIRYCVVVLLSKLQDAKDCQLKSIWVWIMTYSQGINELLARHDFHASQSVQQVHLLFDLRGITLDTEGEETGGTTTAKGEQADPLAFEFCRLDGGEKGGQTSIQRCSVHVSETTGASHSGVDSLSEGSLSSSDERLFNVLVGQ